MKILKVLAPAAIALGVTASGAQAAVTVMAGDADCFGGPAVNCTNGFLPPYVSSFTELRFDNSGPGDPVGTDVFNAIGAVSLDFLLNLGGLTATSASLEVRVAGIDLGWDPAIFPGAVDDVYGAGFTLNDDYLGDHVEPTELGGTLHQRKITTLVFSVDIASLVDGGTNTLIIAPETDFGVIEEYAVDYARLTVETAPVQPPSADVPIPAPLALLAGGLGILGFASRRKSAGA